MNTRGLTQFTRVSGGHVMKAAFRLAALTFLLGYACILPIAAYAQAGPPNSGSNSGQTPAVATVDPAVYGGYVGHYRLNETTIMTVSRKGDHLSAQMMGQVLEIFPKSKTEFFVKSPVPITFTFQTDAAGHATALTVHQPGGEFTLPRMSEAAAKQAEDALNARVKSQTPSPGTEPTFRRFFASLLSGKPDYDLMAPGVAEQTRQQLTQFNQLAHSLGPIQSMKFLRVAPNGADVYEVHHEHSVVTWQIMLSADGKIAGAGFQPPPGTAAAAQASGPKGEPGPYRTVSEPASGSPGLRTFRPESLAQFPRHDTLPVVVWGNGGCDFDAPVYAGFLQTIASHGFLVITTGGTPHDGPPGRQATAADLEAAIDWAKRENSRSGSPLKGKIETRRIAVMGQSCGGELALDLGADPRVATIGVFDYGNTDVLRKLHGPVLLINGGTPDPLMALSKATYDAIDDLPAFYGSLHGAGHAGTVAQPGGGEFANVATDWALWQLKGDRKASAMFVGPKCGLCTNPNWDTGAKRLVH